MENGSELTIAPISTTKEIKRQIKLLAKAWGLDVSKLTNQAWKWLLFSQRVDGQAMEDAPLLKKFSIALRPLTNNHPHRRWSDR